MQKKAGPMAIAVSGFLLATLILLLVAGIGFSFTIGGAVARFFLAAP